MKEFKLYEQISNKGLTYIRIGQEYIDNWINSDTDRRMGISLLIRPTNAIKHEVQSLLEKIKETEPSQYYYPIQDIHVTLFDLITAKQDFNYTNKQINVFKEITQLSLNNTNKFKINFDGIIASDGAIIVKGYYDKQMDEIRQRLRKEILNHNLKNDERYTTKSCHMTIARFSKNIQERKKLIDFIKKHNRHAFGQMEVSEIELIYHNWYDSKKEIIHRYKIA